MATVLTRNLYESLRSLLSEIDDIEDTRIDSFTHIAVHGNLSKDNITDLRKFMEMD